MKKFLIRDIQSLTGIKSHTLRVWEQRYDLIKPKRTETNIRFYDDNDLKLLLNISVLNDHGIKISEIARMSHEEIARHVETYTDDPCNFSCQIQIMCQAMIELDEQMFEKVLNTNFLKLGLEQTMIHIVFPFLKKIGVMWQTGTINPAQEHFISHLIKQKLHVAIDAQLIDHNTPTKKYLLFLPAGETHEIGLLFANYVIRSRGHKVLYLGQNLSYEELKPAIKYFEPDYVVSLLTTTIQGESIGTWAKECCKIIGNAKLILGGYQITTCLEELPSEVHLIHSGKDLPTFIDNN